MTAAGVVNLSASLPGGRTVGGQVYRVRHGPHDVLSLWQPRVVWEFSPDIGDTGADGMDAAIAALRGWLEREVPDAERSGDCAVQVTWPSEDVATHRALLGHGLVPTTVLATRTRGALTAAVRDDVNVRTATSTDVADVARIISEEMRYSADVLGARWRTNAAELLITSVQNAVGGHGRAFLAEIDGVAQAATVCGLLDPGSGPALRRWLPSGRWGYIGQFAVLPQARGTGVGGALLAESLRRLEPETEHGTFLFYELANPLSSVFWPRRGYRPVATRWVCRPASCLR